MSDGMTWKSMCDIENIDGIRDGIIGMKDEEIHEEKRWARAAQAGKHLGSCPILHMNGFAINRVTLKRRQGAIMTRAIRVNTGNSWAILRDIILRNTASRSESYITPIKGFEFHRQVSNADPKTHFVEVR